MMDDTQTQMAGDAMSVPDLPQAVENWRFARHECQVNSTPATLGLYCGATDELARALLGDLAGEPGSQAVFQRFRDWLIATEEVTERVKSGVRLWAGSADSHLH